MQSTIAAFQISRRGIASAVFTGWQLRFWESRSLSSREDAKSSAIAFLNWTLEHFKPESVALAAFQGITRAAQLHQSVTNILRHEGVPLTAIEEKTLFAAFATPPIRSRTELRKIVLQMLPQLGSGTVLNAALDAAALGL